MLATDRRSAERLVGGMMSSVSWHNLMLLSCGIAMFSDALMAPMPWTLVMLPLVAAPVLTMRGVQVAQQRRGTQTPIQTPAHQEGLGSSPLRRRSERTHRLPPRCVGRTPRIWCAWTMTEDGSSGRRPDDTEQWTTGSTAVLTASISRRIEHGTYMPDDTVPVESNRAGAQQGPENADDRRAVADRARDSAEENRATAESAREQAERLRAFAEEARALREQYREELELVRNERGAQARGRGNPSSSRGRPPCHD